MGYSCTAKASFTMEELMNLIRHENSGNTYRGPSGHLYFWERGRENRDGAMTGTVLRFLDNNLCTRVGSYRIDPEGRITRFPGVSLQNRRLAAERGAQRYERVFVQRDLGVVFA